MPLILDKYILRNLGLAAALITTTLIAIVFLSQSLRFLELVIEAAASSGTFWKLTILSLPRFFEILLPLAAMAATMFVYHRMSMDQEVTALRSAGISPLRMAKPALLLAGIFAIFLWTMTLWVTPRALVSVVALQKSVQSQFSVLLLREGVFNQIGKSGLMIYIRERNEDGELRGLMIHDSRTNPKRPSTIMARRGVLGADEEGREIVVFDGKRQELDPKTGNLQTLDFERYIVSLPQSGTSDSRWREPDELTIFELMSPDLSNQNDRNNLKLFRVEIHRRILAPLLILGFTGMACAALLLAPVTRKGLGLRITVTIAAAIALQAFFMAGFNMGKKNEAAILMMYAAAILPGAISFIFLSGWRPTIKTQADLPV